MATETTQTISLRDYAETRRFVAIKHCTQVVPLGTLWAIGSSADDPEDLLDREGEVKEDGSWIATESDFDPENLRKEVTTLLTAWEDEAEWDEIEEEYWSDAGETRKERFERIIKAETAYYRERCLSEWVATKEAKGFANPVLAAQNEMQGYDDMLQFGVIGDLVQENDIHMIDHLDELPRVGKLGVDLFYLYQEGYGAAVTSLATPSEIRKAVGDFFKQDPSPQEDGE